MLVKRLRPTFVPVLLVLLVLAARPPLAAQQIKRTLSGTRHDSTLADAQPHLLKEGRTGNAGYGVIDGLVTDSSLTPLLGARVSILRTSLSVATGLNGRFRIVDIPSGQYIVIVRRGGFNPTSLVLQVNPSDTVRTSYVLQPAVNELAPVTITAQRLSARMQEFENHRKAGIGEFMTQEQIERHNPAFPTELLRLFSSINVVPTSTGGPEIYYPVSARATGGMTPTGQAACFMTVFLDRVPMPSPFSLDLLPSPREMAGIEVYAGAATMPIQYAGLDRGCGIILIWTKDGYSDSAKKP
jgi:Carboxypeptidase regulatory-like domain